jgi:transcriptional regulator with XRE-family HTH domain
MCVIRDFSTIGEVLAVYRKSMGLKQGVVAKQVGITQTGLCLVEHGKRQPSPKLLKNLFTLYGIRIELHQK